MPGPVRHHGFSLRFQRGMLLLFVPPAFVCSIVMIFMAAQRKAFAEIKTGIVDRWAVVREMWRDGVR